MRLLCVAYWLLLIICNCYLERHQHASLSVDDIDIKNEGKRMPFLFEPHEFTLSCRELKHRCIHQAKGLIILQNECYKSISNEDIQHNIWKRNKKSQYLLTGYHICRYYTCRTFADQCKLYAVDKYISTLTCEHHYDHKKQLRYLVDMKCIYNDSCFYRKKQCEENKNGWNIKINKCQQIKKMDQYNLTYIQYIEQCEYQKPKQWKFDNDLLEYWQHFDVFGYTENLMITDQDNSYHSKVNTLNELHDKYQKYRKFG